MRYLFIVLFILLSIPSHAQNAPGMKPVTHQADANSVVYNDPGTKAYFPYGHDSLDHFIKKNMRFRHVENEGTGKAIVVFIVETNGSIVNAEIISTSGDNDFDKEAVRVVKTIRGWKPAMNKGKVVRSTAMLSVVFNVR